MGGWDRGSTRAWRTTRARVLARDAALGCRAHREGPNGTDGPSWCDLARSKTPHTCTGRGEHAHHTRGRRVTGDDERHIIAACGPCNLHIGEPRLSGGDPPCEPVTDWT